MNIPASIHQSRNRVIRFTLVIILAVSLVVPALSSILLSSSANALVGEYEWNKVEGADKGFVGDSSYWRNVTSSTDGTKLAATVAGGFIYTSADSGATWVERTTSGSRGWQSLASSADGTKLVAAVNGGFIYTSTDSGATWVERTTSGSRPWESVASNANGTKLVAGTWGGYMYTSLDSGATWVQQTSLGTSGWYSMALSTDGTKIAVGSSQYIYTSTDSGVTWTQRSSAGEAHWKSIASSADGTKLSAVRSGGFIYTSTDSGVTWTQRTASTSQFWRSITSSADGTKLAAIIYGDSVYTSTDAGATWQTRIVPASDDRHTIVSSADGNRLTMAVWSESIFTSDDAGVHWVERTTTGAQRWHTVASSADGTKLAAVDSGGSIYTSTDSGVSWVVRSSAGYRVWCSIASSADGTKLVAIADGGFIYTSNDSGVTWSERAGAGSRAWNTVSSSADGSKILAGTWQEGLAQSIDYGATWSEVTSIGNPDSLWSGVAVSTDGTTFIAADTYGVDENGGYLYVSHNSGATWIQQTSLGARYWNDYGPSGVSTSSDGETILVNTTYDNATDWNPGTLLLTHDGGATWNTVAGVENQYWVSVSVSSDGTRLVATSDNGSTSSIYISLDGGITWQDQTPDGLSFNYSVSNAANGNKLFIPEWRGGIYIATLTQPTLEFTPSENPADDPIVPTSTNPAAPQAITQTQPTFTGVTYPNSPVTVTVHSDPITCSTVSDAQGNWSCTLPASIPAGNHTVVIELTNATNNQTETLGPYYVQVLGDSTTITNTTPFAPNTGIRPQTNTPLLISGVFTGLAMASVLTVTATRITSKR